MIKFILHSIEKTLDIFFALKPQQKISKSTPKWVAHRGAPESQTLENTLACFAKCLEDNIWGIEFDIRWTYDNVPVVHHDSNCERLFSRPDMIINKTYFTELRNEIPEIPSLQEVMAQIQKKAHYMIELKSSLSPKQEGILFNQLSSLTPCLDYHLLGLTPDILQGLKLFSPKCFVLVSEFNHKTDQEFVIKQKWAGYASHYFLVSDSQIRRFHGNNIKIGTGYIASQNCLNRELNRQVDWLFTNSLSVVRSSKI